MISRPMPGCTRLLRLCSAAPDPGASVGGFAAIRPGGAGTGFQLGIRFHAVLALDDACRRARCRSAIAAAQPASHAGIKRPRADQQQRDPPGEQQGKNRQGQRADDECGLDKTVQGARGRTAQTGAPGRRNMAWHACIGVSLLPRNVVVAQQLAEKLAAVADQIGEFLRRVGARFGDQ